MRPIASGGYRQTPTGRAVRGLEPPVVLPRVVTLVHSRCLEYRTSVLVTTQFVYEARTGTAPLVTPAACPLVGQPRGTYTDFCEVSSTPTVVHLTSWTSRESNPTPGVAACGPNARRNQVEAHNPSLQSKFRIIEKVVPVKESNLHAGILSHVLPLDEPAAPHSFGANPAVN